MLNVQIAVFWFSTALVSIQIDNEEARACPVFRFSWFHTRTTQSTYSRYLPEVVHEVVHHVQHRRRDVVEGDGRVAAAGCAVLLKTEKHQHPSTILQQYFTSFHFVYSS